MNLDTEISSHFLCRFRRRIASVVRDGNQCVTVGFSWLYLFSRLRAHSSSLSSSSSSSSFAADFLAGFFFFLFLLLLPVFLDKGCASILRTSSSSILWSVLNLLKSKAGGPPSLVIPFLVIAAVSRQKNM